MKSNHVYAVLNAVLVIGLLLLADVDTAPAWARLALGVVVGWVVGQVAIRLFAAENGRR